MLAGTLREVVHPLPGERGGRPRPDEDLTVGDDAEVRRRISGRPATGRPRRSGRSRGRHADACHVGHLDGGAEGGDLRVSEANPEKLS